MSDTTPRLTLPLVGDHAQKRIIMNAALLRLESLVQAQVLSRTTAAQPTGPADGDAYILPPGATGGQWAAFAAGDFVRFDSALWEVINFPGGAVVHVADENRFVVRLGGGWAAFEAALKALDNLTHLGINTTADSSNVLAVKGPAALMSAQYAGLGGSGDISLAVNKEADGDTAQVLLQSNYSTRAILGLLGDNNLTLKVSHDGSAFTTALTINAATGVSRLSALTLNDSALTLQDDADATKQAQFQLSSLSSGVTRTFTLPNVSATLAHTGAAAQSFAGQLALANGVDSAPSLAFNSNYGLFYDSTNAALGVSAAGVQAMRLGGTGILLSIAGGASATFNANGEAATGSSANRFSANATGATMSVSKGRGTIAAPAVPNLSDALGQYQFRAWNGTGFTVAASIAGTVIETSTVDSSHAGTRLTLNAAAIGSGTVSEIARLEAATGLSLFGANPVIDQNRNHRLRVYTVATLPAAATAAGQAALVSDASAPAFAATVSGGGSTFVPVYSDGSNWRAG